MHGMEAVLSLDIGGTKIAAAAMTREGETIAKRRAPSAASEGPHRMIERLLDMARAVGAEAGLEFGSIGVSCGGPLDPLSGVVLSPPNLPGWDRTPLRAMLARGIGIEPSRVHVENDGNAGALAEARFGAARGRSHAIYMTMSTGIGGGLILDGRLYRGATFNAGEIGHQLVLPDGPRCGCGKRGCLESVASGTGIASRLRERFESLSPRIRREAGSSDKVTAEHLFLAVRQGDPVAVQLLEETIMLLARGIANLVFILNPQIVILGTIAWHAGDLMMTPLRGQVSRLCWPALTRGLEIVASPLGSRLEDLSGLAVALEAEVYAR